MRERARAVGGRAPERGRVVFRRQPKEVAQPESRRAPRCSKGRGRHESECQSEGGFFSAPVIRISKTPKPLERDDLSKNRVAALQTPLHTKPLVPAPIGLRFSEPRLRRNCGAAAVPCGPLHSTLPSYIRHQSKAVSVRVLKREGSSQEGSSGVGICTFLFNFTPQQCYEPDTIVLFIRKGNCS